MKISKVQSPANNKTLVIAVRNYAKNDSKMFWHCSNLLKFFSLFQIICPAL